MTSAPKITPKHQRHLLPPRRRADQLAGLQVLEIVVGDGGDAEDDRGHEQGEGDQRLWVAVLASDRCRTAPARISEMPRTDKDADARNRAVRGADQAGHVAGDRGDHDAGAEDVEQRQADACSAGAPAIGPLSAKADSSSAIGIIEARIVPATMVIGRSRSVSGRLSPCPAAAHGWRRSRP